MEKKQTGIERIVDLSAAIARTSEECRKCGKCCKVLAIRTLINNLSEEDISFFKMRGGVIEGNILVIPSICPNLKGKKCKIYKNRSLTCKVYGLFPHVYYPEGCIFREKYGTQHSSPPGTVGDLLQQE